MTPLREQHVDVHHRLQPVHVGTMHRPGDSDACVVHQHADGRVLTRPVFDPHQIRRRRQVRLQNVYGTAGLGTLACGQSVQPGFIAGHQDTADLTLRHDGFC